MTSALSVRAARVHCVIVAYQPNVEHLASVIRHIRSEASVVVVSNADQTDLSAAIEHECRKLSCSCISLGRNVGVAAAQNVGIKHALERHADYVFLLDDDSEPSTDCLSTLLRVDLALREAGLPVAATCARCVDRATGESIVYDVDREGKNQGVPVRDLMSSGALIHRRAIEHVGLMDESLFIDCVDYEWGWRARAAGYGIFVSNRAEIRHTLGKGVVRFLGLRIGMPAPIRHYYQFRNVLLMARIGYAPIGWRLTYLVLLPPKSLVYLCFGDQKMARLGFMVKGFLHGVRGLRGPIS